MKSILLVSGHKSGYNKSDITGVNEGDLNIELVRMLAVMLADYALVTVYPVDRDMYQDNRENKLLVNYKDYDYIFEVHFNAYNGSARGSSVQLHTDYTGGISVEQCIIDNIALLGFKKRGVNGIVRRNDLLNMNKAYREKVDYALLETCFYDNKEDMRLYEQKKSEVAWAIADGIISAFGLDMDSSDAVGIVKDCSSLNVREMPNHENIIAIVKAGTKLKIRGTGKDSDGDIWYQVTYKNVTGYVWPKYIEFVDR